MLTMSIKETNLHILIIQVCLKLIIDTFRALALRRWPIHVINPVDKTKLTCYTPHRRSTTVSLETDPSIL